MAINKIVYGDDVLLDLTSDTITAEKLLQGYTAHDSNGNVIIGTLDANALINILTEETETSETTDDITTDVLTLTFNRDITFRFPYISLEAAQNDIQTLAQAIIDNGSIFIYSPVRLVSASFLATEGGTTINIYPSN